MPTVAASTELRGSVTPGASCHVRASRPGCWAGALLCSSPNHPKPSAGLRPTPPRGKGRPCLPSCPFPAAVTLEGRAHRLFGVDVVGVGEVHPFPPPPRPSLPLLLLPAPSGPLPDPGLPGLPLPNPPCPFPDPSLSPPRPSLPLLLLPAPSGPLPDPCCPGPPLPRPPCPFPAPCRLLPAPSLISPRP